jgi:hypothetical protein
MVATSCEDVGVDGEGTHDVTCETAWSDPTGNYTTRNFVAVLASGKPTYGGEGPTISETGGEHPPEASG